MSKKIIDHDKNRKESWDHMDNITTEKSVNWEKHWFTEQEIMNAPVEEKLDTLMNLTSTEAVNAGFSRWLDEWLIDILEENGVVVLEREE